jgi:hypothetical protein
MSVSSEESSSETAEEAAQVKDGFIRGMKVETNRPYINKKIEIDFHLNIQKPPRVGSRRFQSLGKAKHFLKPENKT